MKIGDKCKVNPSNDNDCYNSFRNEILIVTHVANNVKQHPGYDNSVYPDKLYDLKTISGVDINYSLYDYELIQL